MTQEPYWLDYLPEDAKQDALKDMQARSADDAEQRLRMIVSHATGGNLQYDPAMSVNAICCEITAMRNKVWQHAQEALMDSLTPRPATPTNPERLVELARTYFAAKDVLDARVNGHANYGHLGSAASLIDAERELRAALSAAPLKEGE